MFGKGSTLRMRIYLFIFFQIWQKLDRANPCNNKLIWSGLTNNEKLAIPYILIELARPAKNVASAPALLLMLGYSAP